MYNTDLAKEPTLDDVLSKTTEYDIYRQYIGHNFKLNQIMSSPLRTDSHPSFGIYKSSKTGELLFKDQATGDSGNCIKFVSLLHNIAYHSALKNIWKEVIVNNITKSDIGKKIKEYNPSNNIILVEKRNFSKVDDDYWGEFGITRDDLKEFNVFPISKFWVNDILQSYYYTKECPMYCYTIFNKFKIYRPYADKKDKWRTNAGTYDIQGYEQLPDKCEHIIITKSLKDVMTLRKLGYYAIAPNGENHTIPESVINKLKNERGTTKFTIFYDNDLPGIKATRKLLEKYPEFYNTFIDMQSGCKDISDYVQIYGLEKAKEWIITQHISV